MTLWTVALAIVVGVTIGLLMNRNKGIDLSRARKLKKSDFIKNMRKGQLIDIRKKDEFAKDKIKGARNFKASAVASKYSKLRKDQSVYIYCSKGNKSYRTARKMVRRGFQDIFVLENGFNNFND